MRQLLTYILIYLSFLSCSTTSKPQAEMLAAVPDTETRIEARSITIYWIRHGYSCANAVQDVGGWQQYLHTLVKDPLLTNTGIENAAAIGTQLQEIGLSWLAVAITCNLPSGSTTNQAQPDPN